MKKKIDMLTNKKLRILIFDNNFWRKQPLYKPFFAFRHLESHMNNKVSSAVPLQHSSSRSCWDTKLCHHLLIVTWVFPNFRNLHWQKYRFYHPNHAKPSQIFPKNHSSVQQGLHQVFVTMEIGEILFLL